MRGERYLSAMPTTNETDDDENLVEWEIVENTDSDSTERLAVPGGWLVRTQAIDSDDDSVLATALVFLPDAKHEWLAD